MLGCGYESQTRDRTSMPGNREFALLFARRCSTGAGGAAEHARCCCSMRGSRRQQWLGLSESRLRRCVTSVGGIERAVLIAHWWTGRGPAEPQRWTQRRGRRSSRPLPLLHGVCPRYAAALPRSRGVERRRRPARGEPVLGGRPCRVRAGGRRPLDGPSDRGRSGARKLVPTIGRETIRLLLLNHDLKPWREKKLVHRRTRPGIHRQDGRRPGNLRAAPQFV